MLFVPDPARSFGLFTASWGTTRPAASQGTLVTPGTTDYGSYAQLGSALAADAYGILININSNYNSGTCRNSVCTIGIDPAGGTSFSAIINDLLCGSVDTYAATGRVGNGNWYYFPLFIPSGATIGAKAWSSVVTGFYVGCIVFQKPSNLASWRTGSFVETLGSYSQPSGISITPGTTDEGSWTSMGTTTKTLWWLQFGFQVATADTSWSTNAIQVDLAVGDGSNYDIIALDNLVNTGASEAIMRSPYSIGLGLGRHIPGGATIYMRAQSSGIIDSYNALVYGCG